MQAVFAETVNVVLSDEKVLFLTFLCVKKENGLAKSMNILNKVEHLRYRCLLYLLEIISCVCYIRVKMTESRERK